MMHLSRCQNGRVRSLISAVAPCGLSGVAGAQPAAARGVDPQQIFRTMTDYLAGQKALSFNYDATLDIVTEDMIKVALASSGSFTLQRPDRARMTRVGVADGRTDL